MQVIIIGAMHMVGTSNKSGQPKQYDFAVLYGLKGIESRQGASYNRTAFGYEVAEIRALPEVVRSLQSVKQFPVRVELTIDNELGANNQLSAICTAWAPVKSVAAA